MLVFNYFYIFQERSENTFFLWYFINGSRPKNGPSPTETEHKRSNQRPRLYKYLGRKPKDEIRWVRCWLIPPRGKTPSALTHVSRRGHAIFHRRKSGDSTELRRQAELSRWRIANDGTIFTAEQVPHRICASKRRIVYDLTQHHRSSCLKRKRRIEAKKRESIRQRRTGNTDQQTGKSRWEVAAAFVRKRDAETKAAAAFVKKRDAETKAG